MAAADRLQDLVQRLSEDTSHLVRSEIQLAQAEVKEKIAKLAAAAAMGAAAAAIALVGLFALIQAIIDALGLAVPDWLAALIVALVLFAGAGILALMAARSAKRGAPPVPQKAIAEARATADTLREVVP
jgi:uncharacterized membrane protein YqjE